VRDEAVTAGRGFVSDGQVCAGGTEFSFRPIDRYNDRLSARPIEPPSGVRFEPAMYGSDFIDHGK